MSAHHQGTVAEDEEDPIIKKLEKTGCLEKHYAVLECMADHKDWRKCQEQVKEFRSCMTSYEHSKNQKTQVD